MKKHNPKNAQYKKLKNTYAKCAGVFLSAALLTTSVFADDPLATINNLSDFVFAAIRAVGIIVIGFGLLQFGMSFQSHDPSQRTNGLLCVAGGIVIAMAKPILDLILV